MPLATVDDLVAALPGQIRRFNKSGGPSVGAANFSDLWLRPGLPGAAANPPAPPGEIPTKATSGALPFTNPTAPKLTYLAGLEVHGSSNVGTLMLIDRLWHCTIDGTVTGSQTINSPALTRLDAGGMDTELWIACITATSGQTLTVNYTNAAGTSGRSTTVAVPTVATRALPIPLQAGDSGIQSIQSVSLGVSAAGSFELFALRRLAEVSLTSTSLGSDRDGLQLGFPRIYDNSCLGFMFLHSANAGSFAGRVQMVQS